MKMITFFWAICLVRLQLNINLQLYKCSFGILFPLNLRRPACCCGLNSVLILVESVGAKEGKI